MYSDLPSELHREIAEYFNPCEQVILSQVDIQARDLITTETNYARTAQLYDLPSFYGRSPLRHLCHYYNIVKDGQLQKYWYLFRAATQGKDVEWLLTTGLDLIDKMKARYGRSMHLIEFLIRMNNVEGLEIVLKRYDELMGIGAVYDMLDFAKDHGNIQAYEFVESYFNVEESGTTISISDIAAQGHEDMVNYLDAKFGMNHSEILAGYLIGGHQDLYSKYSNIYQEQPYTDDQLSLAVRYGDLEIVKHIVEYEIQDDRDSYLRWLIDDKSPKVKHTFEYLRDLIPPEQLSDLGYIFLVVQEANYILLEEYLKYLPGYVVNRSLPEKLESLALTPMMSDFEAYSKCVRLLLNFLVKHVRADAKHMLLVQARKSGNLELIEILG